MTPTIYTYHQEGQPDNDYSLAISKRPSTPNLFGLGSGDNNVSIFSDPKHTVIQYRGGIILEGTLEVQKINGREPPFPDGLVRTSEQEVQGSPAFRVFLSKDVTTASIAVRPICRYTARQILELK